MTCRHLAWLLISCLAAPLSGSDAGSSEPRIVVGPNMLVSRDGDFPHVELILATNPRNVKNMAGGAITYTRPKGGTACRAYATVDGGVTWKRSEFAEQVEWGGADPYVAFTPHGTAIFSALAMKKDESGRTRGFLHTYRSEDGGMTWSPATELGYSYDHEQIAVDHTTGRFAGRIYIGVLYGYPVYTVGVFRSEDDGRSWIGPVEAANGGGTIGINEFNPMVLSDGTLVLPYADFEFLPDKRKTTGTATSNVRMVLSEDGGISFGEPREVLSQQWNLDDKVGKSLGTMPAMAADSRSEEFRDNIYVAWTDSRFGRTRLLFSRSEDRGLHWSEPMLVDAGVPEEAYQFQPVVAVNKDGVVGVSWFDSREATDATQYHQYFTASLDGGKTLLPPVQISSAPSTPAGPGNMTFGPLATRFKESSYLSLVSAASRWRGGGDYMGLAADKEGVFHPFWADSRSGTFQIYTAAVTVSAAAEEAGAPGGQAPQLATPDTRDAPPLEKVDLEGRVELVFDPTRYDAATREAEIPVRLVNTSEQAILPPITLEILGFGFDDPEAVQEPYPPPTVVNATNGETGEGAVFDFSQALGNLDSLAPGAQTGPIVLRLRFEDPTEVKPIRYRIEGMTVAGP